MRSFLYRLARLLGDLNAIERGKIGTRVVRKVAGRLTGGLLNRLIK